MRTTAWIAGGTAVILVLLLLVFPGALRGTKSHFTGLCRALPTAAGTGDIAIDNTRGIAYLAYLDRTPGGDGKLQSGTVMLVDLKAAEPHIRAALLSDPPDFRPVALSLYIPPRGARRLFVVDAGIVTPAIQIFEQASTGAFALVKTISEPLLVNPTSIVATGPEQFYVTLDPSWRDPRDSSRFARLYALALPSSRSSVTYYDGQRFTAGVSGLEMAAGLAASADGRTLYVSELGGKRLQIFERDATSGALKPKQSLALPSLPHHISADTEGNIWIASYPRAVAALKALEGTPVKAPTQVLKLAANATNVSEFYVNDGSALAGGSAAAAYAQRVLIASLSDRRLLLCQ
jgi:sugar lactone lactonase YvrE